MNPYSRRPDTSGTAPQRQLPEARRWPSPLTSFRSGGAIFVPRKGPAPVFRSNRPAPDTPAPRTVEAERKAAKRPASTRRPVARRLPRPPTPNLRPHRPPAPHARKGRKRLTSPLAPLRERWCMAVPPRPSITQSTRLFPRLDSRLLFSSPSASSIAYPLRCPLLFRVPPSTAAAEEDVWSSTISAACLGASALSRALVVAA